MSEHMLPAPRDLRPRGQGTPEGEPQARGGTPPAKPTVTRGPNQRRAFRGAIFAGFALIATAIGAPAYARGESRAPQGPLPSPAPACGGDKPIAAIAVSDGGPRAVLVAVWDDGRIVRALSEKEPARGYAQAQLSPSVMEEVRATLLRMRYWKWPPSKSGGEAKLQMTMACVESHPASFEHKGKPSLTSGAGQLRDYLMRLRLPSPIRADDPLPEVWLAWFRDDGGLPIPVP